MPQHRLVTGSTLNCQLGAPAYEWHSAHRLCICCLTSPKSCKRMLFQKKNCFGNFNSESRPERLRFVFLQDQLVLSTFSWQVGTFVGTYTPRTFFDLDCGCKTCHTTLDTPLFTHASRNIASGAILARGHNEYETTAALELLKSGLKPRRNGIPFTESKVSCPAANTVC